MRMILVQMFDFNRPQTGTAVLAFGKLIKGAFAGLEVSTNVSK